MLYVCLVCLKVKCMIDIKGSIIFRKCETASHDI